MARAPKFADEEKLAQAVKMLLDEPRTPALLATYFSDDTRSGFAGRLFDIYGHNPPAAFSGDDLLAASMLDVRFGPSALRRIVVEQEFNKELAALHTTYSSATITDMAANSDLYNQTTSLYRRMLGVAGVGETRASKLLARKRPALVPIGDSVVLRALGINDGEHWWRTLGAVLARTDISNRLIELAQPLRDVDTLRVLDVTAWMLHSRSRAAKAARAAAAD